MAETSNEKSFIDNTIDKVTDFINPNKIKDNASFKDTFNKAIENWIITKDELDALMTRFESEKKDLWKNTQEQLNNLRKEAVTNMLKNGYDIRDSKDIENLRKFLVWIPDLAMSPDLLLKIENLNKFYEWTQKSWLDWAMYRTLDVLKVKDITLTLNEKNEIVEMGILDFNNPLNDNEWEIDKTKYNLDDSINIDNNVTEEKNANETKKEIETEIIPPIVGETKEEADKGIKKKKTNEKEASEKHKSPFEKAKEYNSKYSKEQIKTIQMVLWLEQDWKFWHKTFKAVEDFQRENKLKVNWKVWPKTRAEMWISLWR